SNVLPSCWTAVWECDVSGSGTRTEDAQRKRGANTMTTPVIDHYLYLLEAAFAGPDWHSLLSNLHTVAPKEWTWVPPGGRRSIRDIVRHVGSTKLMYHDHAFGTGTLTWDDPLVDADEATADGASSITWLRMGQERLRGGVDALTDDAELLQTRRTNWG